MTGSDGRLEFFTRETGEYLDALSRLTEAGPPPGEEFVRLARSVRGAAMLAGPLAYTRAASRLEQLAKLVRDGELRWEAAAADIAAALREFGSLLRQVAGWGPAQETAAEALGQRLEGLVARAGTAAPAEPPRPAPGIGEFVADQLAGLADALKAATRSREALARVPHAMQSLRGLAGLSELAPLPDLLDALDAAAAELERLPGEPESTGRMLEAGHAAVRRMEAAIRATGRCAADLPEVSRFADRLFDALVRPPGVLPIESLAPEEPARPIGTWPAAEPVQLAAIGERLRQAAGQLRGTTDPSLARLQQFVLLTAVRTAPGGLGSRPAGLFLSAIAEAIELGTVPDAAAFVAELLDRAGARLATMDPAAEGADPVLTGIVDELRAGPVVPIEALLAEPEEIVPIQDLLAEPGEVVPIEALLEEEGVVVPIEDLVEAEPTVVSIESLLEPDGTVVPIETLLVAAAAKVGPFAPPPGDRTMLERSLTTYSTLVRTSAPVMPFEELLLAAGGAAPRWSRSAALEIEAELDAIPIENLVYHGQAALNRAEVVRQDLETALRSASDEIDRVEPLVRELLDLVPLALVNRP